MKELVPACPHCNTSKFVVRDRIAEKAGTLIGGTIGAGSAYAGLSSGATAGAAIGSPYSAQQPEQALERSPAPCSAFWLEAQPATP